MQVGTYSILAECVFFFFLCLFNLVVLIFGFLCHGNFCARGINEGFNEKYQTIFEYPIGPNNITMRPMDSMLKIEFP